MTQGKSALRNFIPTDLPRRVPGLSSGRSPMVRLTTCLIHLPRTFVATCRRPRWSTWDDFGCGPPEYLGMSVKCEFALIWSRWPPTEPWVEIGGPGRGAVCVEQPEKVLHEPYPGRRRRRILSFATGDCRIHCNRGLSAAPEPHFYSDEQRQPRQP